MNIILTGGHLTPAYAFAEIASMKGDRLLLIGSAGVGSAESIELKQLGIEYQHLSSIKYDRYNKFKSIIFLPGLIVSFIKAIRLIKQFDAELIVTFGSYNAVPVALAARFLRIPYITHEQTRSIGLANKLIAGKAKACAVSYPESLAYFPKQKTKLIGNLLRQAIWHSTSVTPFNIPTDLPILYVTGGNQGSETIVKALLSIADTLTTKYQIVLQHGNINPFLSNQLSTLIVARPWFNTTEAAWLYQHAHIVISRGGANTTSELMVVGVPSIIIPLAGSADNEQFTNARVFTDQKAGILVPQHKCSGMVLSDSINQIEASYAVYRAHANELKALQHQDAATALYQIAISALKSV